MGTFRIAPDFLTGVVSRGHVALFGPKKMLQGPCFANVLATAVLGLLSALYSGCCMLCAVTFDRRTSSQYSDCALHLRGCSAHCGEGLLGCMR